MRERVGYVRDQGGGLRVDLAALQAEAAVDAVRTVAERAVGDRDRDRRASRCPGAWRPARPRAHPRRRGAVRADSRADRPTASAARRPAARAPGARSAGADPRSAIGQSAPTPSLGRGLEVGGMKARRKAGVVDHRSADAPARSCSAPARPGPRRRSGGSPSSTARGSRPRLRPSRGRDPRTGPPRAPPPSSRHAPAAGRAPPPPGAAAHDHQVDLVLVAVAAHALHARHAALVRIEQPARVVLLGSDRALQPGSAH